MRKPNRNIQPTLTPAPQSQTPVAAVGGENVSSESTLFTFDFEPADHPVMPSVESLMQISVTLYQTDQNYSGSPKSKGKKVSVTLDQLASSGGSLTDSARVVIQNAIVLAVNRAGVSGAACLVEAAANGADTNNITIVATGVAGGTGATGASAMAKNSAAKNAAPTSGATSKNKGAAGAAAAGAQAGSGNGENIFSPSTKFGFEMQPANHRRMPTEAALMETSVTLYQKGKVYSGSPISKGKKVDLTLDQLSSSGGSLTESAATAIEKAVVASVNTAGVNGVQCLVEPSTTATGQNSIKVVAAQLAGVRTIASGVRGGETGQAINS
ncbi:MAG: hypothetical protein WCQ03_09740, partial [Phycisphaerae bacterium]